MDENGIVSETGGTQYFDIGSNVDQEYNNFNRTNTSAKNERRYELQRKIDEELRKLQLTEEGNESNMEQSGPTRNGTDPASLKANIHKTASEENGHPADSHLDNDNKLGSDVDGGSVNHHDILAQSLSQDAVAADAQNEIDTVYAEPDSHDEVARYNGINPSLEISAVGAKMEQKHDAATTEMDETRTLAQSDDTESDYVGHSSAMTSPTTTTGTYTLPPHSPGTEEDLADDILPIDHDIPTFRGQLERVTSSPSLQDPDVSEVSSDVFLGQQEQTLNVNVPNENTLPAAQHATEPDNPGDAQEVETIGENAETSLTITSQTENEDITEVQDIVAGDENVVSVDDNSLENVTEESDRSSHIEKDYNETGADSKTLSVLDTENVQIELEQSSPVDNDDQLLISSEIATEISLVTDEKKDGSKSDTELQQNVTNADVELPEQQTEYVENVVELSEQQVEYVENIVIDNQIHDESQIDDEIPSDDNADRKVSTDEDEYSGYDIDICESASYQGDVSIAEEDTTEDNIVLEQDQIMEACDSENVPIFADVKYSVGDQIAVSGEMTAQENVDTRPTDESQDMEHPEIVPWGSDGVLQPIEGGNSQQKEESFASDKAGTASSHSKESLSSVPEVAYDEVASAKIAEETVSTAIKAAYDIASKMPEEENVTHSVDDETQNKGLAEPIQLSETSNYEDRGVENFAPVNAVDEIQSDNQSSSEADLEIKGAKSDLVSPREDAEVRENDVTRNAEELNEKIIEVNTQTSTTVAESAFETWTEAEPSSQENPNSEIESLDKQEIESKTKDEKSENNVQQTREECIERKESGDIIEGGESSEAKLSDYKELPDQVINEIKDSGGENEEMVRVNEENSQSPPDKLTYNPALSQRNTEATKWFGQSTSEDKILMKSSGKVDESAEQERKKLIKAMTRKHNPKLIPKWQPPIEKDFTEDLDEKQKSSLLKYEERRRSRTESSISDETQAKPIHSYPPVITESVPAQPAQPLPRENIVIESVVHSKAAIGAWESRLSEKQQKEELERKRLTVGKQKYQRARATSDITRQRSESTSSTTSNSSTSLPTSEHIERESMKISEVRNRWKNIEEESSKTQAETHVKKQPRRSTFSVNTKGTYRSKQSPAPASTKEKAQAPIVNKPQPTTITVQSAPPKNESFIDREIREAAEREEKWKQEQWEKMSEVSATSSEDVFPENSIPPLGSNDPNVITTVYTHKVPAADLISKDILNDADREEMWKTEHLNSPNKKLGSLTPQRNLSKDSSGVESAFSADLASPPPLHHQIKSPNKETDSESSSSYGSSMTGNGISSPPTLAPITQDQVIGDIRHDSEVKSPVWTSEMTSPTEITVIKSEVKTKSTISSVKSPTTLQPVSEQPTLAVTNSTILNTSPPAFDDVIDGTKQSTTTYDVTHVEQTTKTVEQHLPAPSKNVDVILKNTHTLQTSQNTENVTASKPDPQKSTVPVENDAKTGPVFTPAIALLTNHRNGIPDVKIVERNEEIAVKTTENAMVKTETHVQENATKQVENVNNVDAVYATVKKEAQTASQQQKVVKSHTSTGTVVQQKKNTNNNKPAPTATKGGPVFNKKSGPIMSSSKSRLQSVMEREMEEAAAREEEWRRKQMELVNQGIDVTAHPVAHSTREIRTPVTSPPPLPVNAGNPTSSMAPLAPKEVKSLFDDDEEKEETKIRSDAPDEFKKKSVVKAMRVPKRKSMLAMRWEEGNFQNNHPDDDQN